MGKIQVQQKSYEVVCCLLLKQDVVQIILKTLAETNNSVKKN